MSSYKPGIRLSEIERVAILEALEYHGGNRTAAARDLGISARTMQNRVAEYKRGGHDVPPAPVPGALCRNCSNTGRDMMGEACPCQG